jgi:hypothetical protein
MTSPLATVILRAPASIRHCPPASGCGAGPIVTDGPANEQRAVGRQDACRRHGDPPLHSPGGQGLAAREVLAGRDRLERVRIYEKYGFSRVQEFAVALPAGQWPGMLLAMRLAQQ